MGWEVGVKPMGVGKAGNGQRSPRGILLLVPRTVPCALAPGGARVSVHLRDIPHLYLQPGQASFLLTPHPSHLPLGVVSLPRPPHSRALSPSVPVSVLCYTSRKLWEKSPKLLPGKEVALLATAMPLHNTHCSLQDACDDE